MKMDELITTLLAAILVSLGMALTGCGDGADPVPGALHVTPEGDFAPGTPCTEACTKFMNCSKTEAPALVIELLEQSGVYDEAYAGCVDECAAPYPEDEPIRDCALSCDLALDCGAYYACVCGCGVEVYEGICGLPDM